MDKELIRQRLGGGGRGETEGLDWGWEGGDMGVGKGGNKGLDDGSPDLGGGEKACFPSCSLRLIGPCLSAVIFILFFIYYILSVSYLLLLCEYNNRPSPPVAIDQTDIL